MTTELDGVDSERVDRLGRLYDWTAEERDHVAALVSEARETFAAADSEQRRLAGWVLANCPGEPSQDGGVVDTVIRLISSGRGDMEHLERKWRAEARAAGAAEGETKGYERAYVEVYEQHCRKVDPDLEGYGVGDLVSRLLTAIECELEGISLEVDEVMGRFTGRES